MKVNKEFITIDDNENKIKDFIKDMFVVPRAFSHKWSKITNQTPNLKIGYPAQHLASLILGIKGNATGARGEDIADGTEVKSCSLVDQSDKCKKCQSNVLRFQNICPECGSSEIKRNFDSKWLITIHNQEELTIAIKKTRFLFIITDYVDRQNFNDIRIRAFEVYPTESRGSKFVELLENYYYYIYLSHIKNDPRKTPAPKNIFPDNFPFYMCNPVKVFECIIQDSIRKPTVCIKTYIKPDIDRSTIRSEIMPTSLLKNNEREILKNFGFDITNGITEEMREKLELRDTDKKIKIIKK